MGRSLNKEMVSEDQSRSSGCATQTEAETFSAQICVLKSLQVVTGCKVVAMVGGIVGFCGEEVQGAKAQWVGFFNIGSGQVGY